MLPVLFISGPGSFCTFSINFILNLPLFIVHRFQQTFYLFWRKLSRFRLLWLWFSLSRLCIRLSILILIFGLLQGILIGISSLVFILSFSFLRFLLAIIAVLLIGLILILVLFILTAATTFGIFFQHFFCQGIIIPGLFIFWIVAKCIFICFYRLFISLLLHK